MERRERKATCATARESQLGLAKENEVERLRAHLRHDLADLGKVSTPSEPGPCEEVLDQSHADVVAPARKGRTRSALSTRAAAGRGEGTHLVELLVDLVVVFIVLDELYDECTVREREQLGVDLSRGKGSSVSADGEEGVEGERGRTLSERLYRSSPSCL